MTKIQISISCVFTKELEEELLFTIQKIISRIPGIKIISYFNESANNEEEFNNEKL
jgi:hypothetical protein